MTNYLDLDVRKINELLKTKKIKPIDLVEEAFLRIEKSDLNAYISLNKEEALKEAKELENKEVDNLLFAIPIAIKDNILTKDLRTTAASKMLDNFIPVIDAKVIEKIKAKKMIIIGKTNMDEFAMGSTGATSYYGETKNPHDKTRVPGGSSSGSAATIAAGDLRFALGSDTGGSIRQPASFCGIVGMKPTYGRVSRNGLIAFASSLDQIGPMTKTVYENALLLGAISGFDENDLTSSSKETEDFTREIGQEIKGKKIALINFDKVEEKVKKAIERTVNFLEKEGAKVEKVKIDYLDSAVNLYQIIGMAEASSNLARFDGIRYGYRSADLKNLDDLYKKSRSEAFGEEVKRRIMIGSYLLSGENTKNLYHKAMVVRNEMKKAYEKVLAEYDYIIGPITTGTAYKLNEKTDPLRAFNDDVLAIPLNMTGLPGLSLTIGKDEEGLAIGLEIIANYFEEAKIYSLAALIEEKLGDQNV